MGWVRSKRSIAIQVDDWSELDSVAEGPAGGNDRVLESNRTHADAEVNVSGLGGPRGADSLGRTHEGKSSTPGRRRPGP